MNEIPTPSDSINFQADAADEVLAAAAEIVNEEAARMATASEAGYLAVLGETAPDMSNVDASMVTMLTNVHGSTAED